MSEANQPIVLAISGASGAVYALRLLDVLLLSGCRVALTISPAGAAVFEQELGLQVDLGQFSLPQLFPAQTAVQSEPRYAALRALLARRLGEHAPWPAARSSALLTYAHHRDLLSSIASGSARTRGMVVCPCSGGTLSAIAQGASTNLIHRAADVHLKERRKLILVPRETPWSLIQLDNLRRASEAGAVVLPAAPGFYHGVRELQDLVDFIVGRICDHLDVPHALVRRWGDAAAPPTQGDAHG